MRPSAPAGARVTLRRESGEAPEFGTELRTPSGRRYQVIGGNGMAGGNGKTLQCLVLPADAPPAEVVWHWEWTARNKRREP